MAATLERFRYSQDSFLSWATRVSRTQISTVNGLSFSKGQESSDGLSLDGVLRTVQSIGLSRCPFEDLTYLGPIGEGGTFSVAECSYQGKVVAVKYIKLGQDSGKGRFTSLNRRLHSVLQEVCIMHHEPLAKHPTIVSLLGYGWQQSGGAPLPYLVVERGEPGSLRSWLRNKSTKGLNWLRSKLTLAGDVAAGLMALHQCGIVHGDLKLDNVIVFEEYLDRSSGAIAKIADFGHSILRSSDHKTKTKYYGSSLYNAPEVFTQESNPIELAQMHKCDIWSYGLLVWEILADGDLYFKYSWRSDPAFAHASSKTSEDITPCLRVSSEGRAFDEYGDSHVFGTFDVGHLRSLAREYVRFCGGPEAQFEKSFLRPFFERTLQVDPYERPSDLTKLPIMRHWNQTGVTRLRSKLAMQLKSSELSFDMFRIESTPEIPWSDQKGMLEDIERIASWQQGGARSAVAAYQTALCYIFGFGTANDSSQARFYLHKAAELSHPVASLFNERILPALGEPQRVETRNYTQLLSQVYQANSRKLPDHINEVKLMRKISSEIILENVYTQPLSTSDFLAKLPDLIRGHEQINVSDLCLYMNNMQFTILEAAIFLGNADLVSRLVERLQPEVFEIVGIDGETPLIQACKKGRADIVLILLKSGARLSVRSVDDCTILNWLFCIEEQLAMIEGELLTQRDALQDVIDLSCKKVYTIHKQWPLRLHGTPLAFAAIAGSHKSIELLLKLGADPTAKVFSNDVEVLNDWNALHLAIKYHQPTICLAMLNQCDRLLKKESAASDLLTPYASALAFSSTIERQCIHSQNHAEALDQTILRLPSKWFFTMSADGRTPLMQAIDYNDIATLQSILTYYPQLAGTRLLDPDKEEQYTYPIHFACQLAAQNDYPNASRIPQIISFYDRQALQRIDSQGRTCLHMAATGVSKVLVDWLLSHGVSADTLDFEGRTAVFAADNLPIFSQLLERTTQKFIDDRNRVSLAHYAVLNERLEVLKELVKRQAPLDSICPAMGTPLHCAIVAQSRSSISILLDAGVDIDPLSPDELTLVELAMKSEMIGVIRELVLHGARFETSLIVKYDYLLQEVSRGKNPSLCQAFLQDFKNHSQPRERAILLHYLSWNKSQASILFLHMLDRECRIQMDEGVGRPYNTLPNDTGKKAHPLPFKLENGQTPMHTAIRFSNFDALKIFRGLAHPFQILVKEEERSPLHLALESLSFDQSQSASSNTCAILLGTSERFMSLLDDFSPDPEHYSFIWMHDTWEKAQSRKDYGTLTAMILLTRFHLIVDPNRDIIRLPLVTAELHNLLSQAIRQGEVGFIIACLHNPRVQYNAMAFLPWLTPAGMIKLYYYADEYDIHLLRWRFQADDETQNLSLDDDEANYVVAGGETRNFRYEWYAQSLGSFYRGHRTDTDYVLLRKRLAMYNEDGVKSVYVNNRFMVDVF